MEKKYCPFRAGTCIEEKCALFDDEERHPGCAFLNLSIIMMNVRDHVQQIDEQGIGVYDQNGL